MQELYIYSHIMVSFSLYLCSSTKYKETWLTVCVCHHFDVNRHRLCTECMCEHVHRLDLKWLNSDSMSLSVSLFFRDLSENFIQAVPRRAFRGATDLKNLCVKAYTITCTQTKQGMKIEQTRNQRKESNTSKL